MTRYVNNTDLSVLVIVIDSSSHTAAHRFPIARFRTSAVHSSKHREGDRQTDRHPPPGVFLLFFWVPLVPPLIRATRKRFLSAPRGTLSEMGQGLHDESRNHRGVDGQLRYTTMQPDTLHRNPPRGTRSSTRRLRVCASLSPNEV